MWKLYSIILLMFAGNLFGDLVPTSLITDPHPIQRFNWSEAQEHLNGDLFYQCWGISKAKIRNQSLETWLLALTDEVGDRTVFFKGVDSLGERYAHWIKKFGASGSGNGEFCHPRGIVVDTTVYCSHPDSYFIYIADKNNDRIVRLYYNASQESIFFYDDTLGAGVLNNPEDVECISINGDSAHMVIADKNNHRILIYKIKNDLTYIQTCAYGTEGSGTGQFRYPNSVCIVPCSDSTGFYRIYVVDHVNYRIVSLLFNSSTSTVSWERTYTDETHTSRF